MKKTRLLVLLTLSTLLLAFCKKEPYKSSVIVRDCTGSYLRFENKDYHVCNPEQIQLYPNGATVYARFKQIEECNGTAVQGYICKLYHANEGWITIEKVRK